MITFSKCQISILILLVTWEITHNMAYGEPDVGHRSFRSGLDIEDGEKELEYKRVGPFPTRPRQSKPTDKNYKQSLVMGRRPVEKSAYEYSFDDEFWKYQWYQHDYRTVDGPVVDHNIVPVQRMGYNGQGITIGVLGERLVRDHPELSEGVSDVFNAITGKVPNKFPPVPMENLATKVAGVVVMKANNTKCGAGIAYNSKLVGITVMSDGQLDEDAWVAGMKHKLASTHIYVDAIKRNRDGLGLRYNKDVKQGLKTMVQQGRNKKGAIYVVGSGDGHDNGDHCGSEFVANSIYTFVIGAAGYGGAAVSYGERCAAVMAAAYTAGQLYFESGSRVDGVVSTDGNKKCTRAFSGTAASAAIASGIFALVLQARHDLTWRDLMHLVAVSSEKAPVRGHDGWIENGAGFWVSSGYGFGLLNAENMVLASLTWVAVPKMVTCKLAFKRFESLHGGRSNTRTMLEAKDCPSEDGRASVKHIEQVELVTSISYRDRSTVYIALTSPEGTQSILFNRRKDDKSTQGFHNWKLRSFNFWGERPAGKWVLTVMAEHNHYDYDNISMPSYLALTISDLLLKIASFGYYGDQIRKAEILVHGTSELPHHYKGTDLNHRRTYSYTR